MRVLLMGRLRSIGFVLIGLAQRRMLRIFGLLSNACHHSVSPSRNGRLENVLHCKPLPRESNTEAWALLRVSTHISVGPDGTLSLEIERSIACFIERAIPPHPAVPTVRYYDLTRTDAPPYTSWHSAVLSLMPPLCLCIETW